MPLDHSPGAAIGELAVLPVAFKLKGRRVALAGGGAGALWKAELLASTGADVRLFANEASEPLAELAARFRNLELVPRKWRAADLEGCALAVLDAEDEAEAVAFRDAARAAGAPVNVVDRPEFCDFSFSALVNRSPLIVAISTDGAAPVFAQAIRARIEALLPAGLADWAKAARDWRARIGALGLSFRARRGFWERFAELALRSGERAPTAEDFDALAQAESAPSPQGRIVLVGAGPGDPDLLTLKAVRALQSADVVLYDRLAPPGALELARREAQRIEVGKRAGEASPQQEEIIARMLELARQGKKVVRLKGGDSAIFGRANEEIAAARAAGVPVTIVPGVTAASAAAADLGISLSDRAQARRVQFVTASDIDGDTPDDLSWRALVDPGATTAVYMGGRKLEAFLAALTAAGLDPETPAVVVENASLATARQVEATVASLPSRLASEPAGAGPLLLLYGRALKRETAP